MFHVPYPVFQTPFSIPLCRTPYSRSHTLYSMLHPPSSILHTPYSILFNPYTILHTAYSMLARLHIPHAVLHIEYSMFHIPHSTSHFPYCIRYTIFCAPYCIMRISASTARLQRRVHMDGHKLSNDVRKMMPAMGGSKVSGVEETLRCAKSASPVTLVSHSSLIDSHQSASRLNLPLVNFWDAFWTTFGPHVGHFSIKCDPVFSMRIWSHICINMGASNNKNVDFAS